MNASAMGRQDRDAIEHARATRGGVRDHVPSTHRHVHAQRDSLRTSPTAALMSSRLGSAACSRVGL
jgi:hypothetical protein